MFYKAVLYLQSQEDYIKAPVTDSGPRSTGPVYNGDVTPKFPWRGLIPSMASTPHDRGNCLFIVREIFIYFFPPRAKLGLRLA